MSQILQNARTDKHIRTISIMIVATAFNCHKLHEAIKKVHISKECIYKLLIVRAECIRDMLEFEVKVPIDFIVFAIDTSLSVTVEQVQDDLNLLDNKFFIGRICFINVTNFVFNNVLDDLITLAKQYKIPIINGDIRKLNKCNLIAERILTLIEANILKPVPFVPWVTQ